jgi:hypothetical protein
MDRLVMTGHQVQTTTVATTLSRLAKNRKVIASRDPDGGTGYAWPAATSASDRLSAISKVMKKSKPR